MLTFIIRLSLVIFYASTLSALPTQWGVQPNNIVTSKKMLDDFETSRLNKALKDLKGHYRPNPYNAKKVLSAKIFHNWESRQNGENKAFDNEQFVDYPDTDISKDFRSQYEAKHNASNNTLKYKAHDKSNFDDKYKDASTRPLPSARPKIKKHRKIPKIDPDIKVFKSIRDYAENHHLYAGYQTPKKKAAHQKKEIEKWIKEKRIQLGMDKKHSAKGFVEWHEEIERRANKGKKNTEKPMVIRKKSSEGKKKQH